MDFCLTLYGFIRFIYKIYVSDNSELKKVIFKEFHVKPYSGHLGYHKTLTIVNKFYNELNLKKNVAEYVARCFDY